MKLLIIILLLLPWSLPAQVNSDSVLVHQLLSKGGQAARNADYDSARYYYTQAEQLSLQANYRHGIMSSTLGHGLVHHYQKEMDAAMEYYLQALEMTNEGIDLNHPDVALLYSNLGGAYIDLGYRLKAREYLKKALAIREGNQDSPSIAAADTHYNIGLVYMYFGENQTALHHFMSAYPVYLDYYGENGARLAQLYTNIGIIHKNLGNIDQAAEYFQRGVAIHLENHGPDYWNLAYLYTNLGSLYVETDKMEQGLEYYLMSLSLCKKNPKELIRLESINEGALAEYYLEEGDYEKSRHHANNAVKIMQETFYDQHPRISEYYLVMGQSYVKEGNFELASYWFDRAKELTVKGYGETHPQISTLYLEQSKIYFETKDFPQALEAAQNALVSMSNSFHSHDPLKNPLREEVLDEKLMLNVLKHKGDVFQGLAKKENTPGNLSAALQQYESAVLIIDYLRRGYLSESAKLFLQNNAHQVYQEAMEVCYQLFEWTRSPDYLERAFYFMEKSKSSVLSEALQASQVTSIEGVDPTVLQKEIELDQLVKSLELKLADAQIDKTDTLQVRLKKDLFHAKARIDSLEDVIRTTYPDYHQLKYHMAVLDLNTVRESLPDRELVLSFYEADSSWYIISISPETVSFRKVSKADLPDKQVNDFRQAIGDPLSEPVEYYAAGQLIYRELLQEALTGNPGSRRLVLVPDGILNYLPFEALITKEPVPDKTEAIPHFLLRDYTVSYRNSLTLYAYQRSRDQDFDQAYVGFAPNYQGIAGQPDLREDLSPLEGARSEVQYAGTIFQGLKFLDQEATEQQFKATPISTSILHLAMHARIDDQEPMRSRLIFNQDGDPMEDGSLNAYEIYQLPLRAELAVLSACNTGRGKLNRGEGVISLSRAFMYAGCSNLVLSLWRAQDQASGEIMNRFFENLKHGMSKDQALQKAKLSYLETADPFKAHPAHWATFVLLGDSRPLSRPGSPWLWWGLGALLLVLVGLYYQKLKSKRKKSSQL